MTSFSGPRDSMQDLQQTLSAKAFLYDHPDDYLAGVEDAMHALAGADARIVVVEDGGREEWLQTLEQYRAAWGPPASGRARSFESSLERQLSA